MSNKEILERAIAKAIEGGWLGISDKGYKFEGIEFEDSHWQRRISVYAWSSEREGWHFTNYLSIVFNHDFAKALWGEEPAPMEIWQEVGIGTPKYRTEQKTVAYAENWRIRLMEMVIAEDPIAYLGSTLEEATTA